jgi:CBS domain-containing protein
MGTIRVGDVMMETVVSVKETDRMEIVAQVFEDQDINAAPVVNATGQCVGILTSHDVVEYEARRTEISNEISHGAIFNNARYGDGPPQFPLLHFDEAGFQMATSFATASREESLQSAAQKMCRDHIHHLIILNAENRPIGIVSALDILGHMVGEPVCRDVRSRNQD